MIFHKRSIAHKTLLIVLLFLFWTQPVFSNVANDFYSASQEQIKKKDYGAAIINLNKAIDANPKFQKAYTDRASCYAILGKFDKAMQDCNEAIKLNPNDAIAYRFRAGVYYQTHKYKQAISDLNISISKDPHCSLSFSGRGGCYVDLKDYAQALKDFEQALRLGQKPDAWFLYNIGCAYFNTGQKQKGLEEFSAAVKMGPKYYEALIAKAQAEYFLGRYDESAATDSMAISINPKSKTPYIKRSMAYRKLSLFHKELGDLELASKLDPSDAYIHNSIGYCLMCLGKYSEAIEELTTSISLDAKYDAYSSRGICLSIQGKDQEAIQDYSESIRLDSKHPEVYLNRGWLHKKLGQTKEAIADLSMAITLDPTLSVAYWRRGCAYAKDKQYEKAIADFTKSASLGSKQDAGFSYGQRGLAYLKIGQCKKAVDDITAALVTDGINPELWQGRSEAYEQLGEQEKSEADLAISKTFQSLRPTTLASPMLSVSK